MLVTFFTYKPLSKALHWEINIKKKDKAVDGIAGEATEDAADAMHKDMHDDTNSETE